LPFELYFNISENIVLNLPRPAFGLESFRIFTLSTLKQKDSEIKPVLMNIRIQPAFAKATAGRHDMVERKKAADFRVF